MVDEQCKCVGFVNGKFIKHEDLQKLNTSFVIFFDVIDSSFVEFMFIKCSCNKEYIVI